MKKIFTLGMILLLVMTCSLPVFAAEESVPFLEGGAYVEGADYGDDVLGGAHVPEEEASLTYEEKQLREAAYNEIFVLSQTDENILGVKLSKDSRWLFLSIADLKDKEYAMKFPQYAEFFIFTDDVEKAYENFNDSYMEGQGEAGGIVGGIDKKNTPFNTMWLWPICGLFLIGTAFVAFFRIRRTPAMQAANGKVLTQSASISAKEVVFSVKQNETAPDANVFDSILHKIDKE